MTRRRDSDVAVRLDGVGKRYGTHSVLGDLNLTLESARVVGIAGCNASGKSTLVNLIGGFIAPSSGTITVLGRSPRRAAQNGEVAVLSQRVQLRADERVLQFLGYLAKLGDLAPSSVPAMLEQLGLSGVGRSKCGELSIGYQRRVALAAALLGKPRVVVLDEPTAGLEPASVRAVHEMIKKLARTASVLVTSPDPAELDAVCDEIHWLDGGRICQVVGDLAATPNLLRVAVKDPIIVESLGAIEGVHECEWNERSLTLDVRLEDGATVGDAARAVLHALKDLTVVERLSFLSAREHVLSSWMGAELRRDAVEPFKVEENSR